jgi:hypothetical protein
LISLDSNGDRAAIHAICPRLRDALVAEQLEPDELGHASAPPASPAAGWIRAFERTLAQYPPLPTRLSATPPQGKIFIF